MPERYVYCKTCGRWDKAWVMGKTNKRRTRLKKWKMLIYKNMVYFGYGLIPCLEKKHHIFQVALTKLQLARKLKRRYKEDDRTIRRIGTRLSRISVS